MISRQLRGADLFSAQMQGAYLGGAQLQGAFLDSAQLQGANLISAQLQGANLLSAQLQRTNLLSAQLQGADLGGAQLQGANLSSAQLQGATSLDAANLLGAASRDVDFTHVPQIAEHVAEIFGDASVTLPEGVEPPPHWHPDILDFADFPKETYKWQATLPHGWDDPDPEFTFMQNYVIRALRWDPPS